jgi:tripartite-type tricarboxylate transporter receptor subunit TctC
MQFRLALVAAVGIVMTSPAVAVEDSVESFYAKHTLDFIVSSGAGAGYDSYARILSRYMPRYIPGKPTIVVRQMEGAGGITAMNYLANIAPKDGSVIAIVNNPVPYLPLLGEKRARFDALKMNWLGSLASEVGFLISTPDSGIDTFQKAVEKGMTVSTSGAGSGSYFNARVLNKYIGANLKIVAGYPSSVDCLLAMERHEVDGFPALMWSTLNYQRPAWRKPGAINVLVQLGSKPRPEYASVPLIFDYVHSDADKQALKLALAPLTAARPVVAAAGLPADRVKVLQDAFEATIKDADFQADVAKERLETFGWMNGAQLAAHIRETYATAPDVVASVAALSHD